MNRRETLLALGGMGVFAGTSCLGWGMGSRRESGAVDPIEQLARSLAPASRDRAFEIAADTIRAGASRETLLGAVMRVGVMDVRPRPHGILHTVMMVHSSFALGDGASEREAWLAALWNLDDLKTAQVRDRDENDDWSMAERSAVQFASPSLARSEFLAAMEAWDAERAERAVIGLLPHIGHDAFFELIWPLAARCNAFIGHKMIHAAQVERALRRISWRQAEPVVRSMVHTLLVDRDTGLWDENDGCARARPARPAPTRSDPRWARELHASLRVATVSEARKIVLEALGEPAGVSSVWDAMRLTASEIFHQRSGRRSNTGRNALLPVHGLTVLNSLGYVARRTHDPVLSEALLLEAATRLPGMRDWLVSSTGLDVDGEPLVALEDHELDSPIALDEAILTGSPAVVCATLGGTKVSAARYGASLRASLLRTAREHHQHKYAVAMLEEGALAHPDLRALILAPGVDYLANPADATSEVHERSIAALEQAGVR